MCLWVFCLGFILFGTLWVSWTWVIISFPILGKFSTIISSSIFSWSFFLSSSSGTPMIQMLGHLTLTHRSLRLCWFLLIRFSFFLSDSFISTTLSSPSLILSSASIFYYLFPQECFLISFIALFVIYWLIFISYRSLLNLSCIFSILVSRLFICNSILFSRFWIIFTIIWNSLSGRSPVFCLVWWAFILFLYLLGISLPLHLVYIAVFGVAFPYSGSLWFLFIVEVPHCGWGLDVWLVKVSWLGKLV